MKEKNTAALFALFLGWLGVHRFYLGQPGLGILYIILITTGISFVLGIIDAIVLLAMDPEEFDRRYNEEDGEYDRYRRKRRERRDFRRGRREEQYTTRDRRRRGTRSRTEYRGDRQRSADRPQRSRQRPARNNPPTQRRKVNPYKQSGIKKYKDFDLQAAIEDFNKGLEIDSTDVSLHFNIACAYSLTEQKDKAYYHLNAAIENGFKDYEKIKNHDDLAYVRIQPDFEEFEQNGFRLKDKPMQLDAPKEDLLSDDLLLSQLKRLAELKEKGLITEREFEIERKKLER